MRHIRGSTNVIDFSSYNPGNMPIVPNNLDCASIVCNHISRVIHVQDKCVVSATSDIIHCYIWKEKTKLCSKDSTSNKNLPAETRGSTTAGGNTYCSLKNKPRNHILLATAIVEVQNKSGQYVPCRALLDSGSESSFITERCVQRLRLSRTETHASIQGISNVNQLHHRVLLSSAECRLKSQPNRGK